MMFPQTFPLAYTMLAAGCASAAIFAWRISDLRTRAISAACAIPSVIVAGVRGSGKTSLIRSMTGSAPVRNPFMEGLLFSYAKGAAGRMQYVELLSDTLTKRNEGLGLLRKLNVQAMIFIFDVTAHSPPIEDQLRSYDYLASSIPGVSIIVASTKKSHSDEIRTGELRRRFGHVHEFYSLGSAEGIGVVAASENPRTDLPKRSRLDREIKDLEGLISELEKDRYQFKETVRP
jgi:hypothetical protein